jgi:alpha-ribazole phosphatase
VSGALTVRLVRHGATAPNAQRRYPHPGEDAPLSPEGEAQARALALPAARLVYSSPARRARQTAALAGHPHPLLAPALTEAVFGVMAGHSWPELEAQYGPAAHDWLLALSDPASDGGPPQGESGRAFHTRLAGWLGSLPASGEVLAFTHHGPILAVLRLTLGLHTAAVAPGRVVTLRRAEGVWWPVWE